MDADRWNGRVGEIVGDPPASLEKRMPMQMPACMIRGPITSSELKGSGRG